MRISLFSRLLLAILAFSMLLGISCPMNNGDIAATTPANSFQPSVIDVGGDQGAGWQVSTAQAVMVTLRKAAGGGIKVTDGKAPLRIGGDTIDLAGFCWRADAICPQHLLSSETLVRQSAAAVLFSFNRRGSLAAYPQGAVLAGALDGPDINLPLTFGQGACATIKGSTLLATAYVDDSDQGALRATLLKGKITLIYSGNCLTYGGSANLDGAAIVELVVEFSAKRK